MTATVDDAIAGLAAAFDALVEFLAGEYQRLRARLGDDPAEVAAGLDAYRQQWQLDRCVLLAQLRSLLTLPDTV